MRSNRSWRVLIVLLVVVLAVFIAVQLAGNGGDADTSVEDDGLGSIDTTLPAGVYLDGDAPTSFDPPPPPMLTKPETSVYSYMVWISYAYKVLDSTVATHAFSAWAEPRVSAYVEYNRQEGRALDQYPALVEYTDVRTEDGTATVTTNETWFYRYIDIQTGDYSSPIYSAQYEGTYTLIREEEGWLVRDVDVVALAEVK